MAARIAVSATVRAVKGRKPFPTRAALVLVSLEEKLISLKTSLINLLNFWNFQTPSAVKRVKELFEGKNDYVRSFDFFRELKPNIPDSYTGWSQNRSEAAGL